MKNFLAEKENDNKLLLDSSQDEDSFEKEMNTYLKVKGQEGDAEAENQDSRRLFDLSDQQQAED
jgi:hypothetical protein